jgi:outer membrane immunogenic protein
VKRVLIAAAAMTVAGVCSVQAADLAARPYYTKAAPTMMAAVYDWSGLYVGLNGGYGSDHNCWGWVNDYLAVAGGVITYAPPKPAGCRNATGGTFGGQIGYRWQAANWVFGVEGQGNWADFSGSNVDLANPAYSLQSRIDSFGLITGQVGYAFNNVLLYVKGGAAVVSNKNDIYRGALHTDTASETRWGGTVGAGLEIGFAPNWSIGVEYNHIFLSDKDVGFTHAGVDISRLVGGIAYTARVSQDIDLALVRLNYKFGGPILAKY